MLVFLAATIFFYLRYSGFISAEKNACEYKLVGQGSLLYGLHSCFSSYRTLLNITRKTSFSPVKCYDITTCAHFVFQMQCDRPLKRNVNQIEKGGNDNAKDQIFATQFVDLVFYLYCQLLFLPKQKCQVCNGPVRKPLIFETTEIARYLEISNLVQTPLLWAMISLLSTHRLKKQIPGSQ